MPSDAVSSWEVLVVDDDDSVRELIVAYFNGLRMSVTSASDGGSAIAMLQRNRGRFGLVVTDVNLPGADGFAVLQAARQSCPSCYVVIITGYASLDSATLAVRVGAYDYLAKPFSLKQLDVILQRISDHSGLEAENRQLARGGSPDAHQGTAVVTAQVALTPSRQDIELRVAQLESAISRIERMLQGGPRRATLARL